MPTLVQNGLALSARLRLDLGAWIQKHKSPPGDASMSETDSTLSYGNWTSPLSAHDVAQASVRIGDVTVSETSVFWGERRPAEGGRTAVVESHLGERIERLAPPWNARTRVHEYGGGAILADGRTLFFSNFADGRVYAQTPGQEPTPLTPEISGPRVGYADFRLDAQRARLIAVEEAHQVEGEPEARIVAISLAPLSGGAPDVTQLVSGADFIASPRLSPDGTLMTWLTWSHPNMPWDGTLLWVADVDESGRSGPARHLTGSNTESIFQPDFDASGNLIFATDRTDWWNLCRVTAKTLADGGNTVEPLAPAAAEFGMPQWVFGMSTWAEIEPGKLVSAYTRDGVWNLGWIEEGKVIDMETPYSTIDSIQSNGAGTLVFVGGCPERPGELVELSASEGTGLRVLNETKAPAIGPEYVSTGEPISYPSANGRTAHAFFYAPRNPNGQAPEGERPPLIVKSHGGPTGAAGNGFDAGIQFWTSRGFAVVDVNYGGSTGYGRAYRETLKGQWGIVDVEDCVAAADYLTQTGRVDATKRAIRGGSAGGYTTLASLAFTDAFQAGASHFGVADLEALARDTHKFESRYLDGLVGPYPERQDLYRERAPLHAAHKISCPVIFFQGLEDKIVPPNQAELMVAALNENGIPNQHVTFEGEGHGFRQADNIVTALETELSFYQDIFGLKG